ncbi:MAG: ABC transporter permease [Myxococcota bacterium]
MQALLALGRTVVRHHHVLTNFVLRDLKVKYRGTVLGYLWSLLEPLSLVLIYWFVFVVIARRGGPDYPLVVILGVLPFQFFNTVVSSGAASLTANASLIRRVWLPRELFVVATALSSLVVLGLSLLVCLPFLLLYQVPIGPRLVGLPAGLALLSAFATGLALALAAPSAIYRDLGYVLRVLLRLGFYASPVIYSIDMVPASIQGWYLLNPLAVYLTAIRSAVMNQPVGFSFVAWLWGASLAVLSLLAGAHLFRRYEAQAVKFL